MIIDNLLKELNACEPARIWAHGKDAKELYNTCDKGQWLLWLWANTMPNREHNKRLLTLAKVKCFERYVPFLEDERAESAFITAKAYGNGTTLLSEFKKAHETAYEYWVETINKNLEKVPLATYDKVKSNYIASSLSMVCSAAFCSFTSHTAIVNLFMVSAKSSEEVGKECADICRDVLPIELWNLNTKE